MFSEEFFYSQVLTKVWKKVSFLFLTNITPKSVSLIKDWNSETQQVFFSKNMRVFSTQKFHVQKRRDKLASCLRVFFCSFLTKGPEMDKLFFFISRLHATYLLTPWYILYLITNKSFHPCFNKGKQKRILTNIHNL